jgi:hypothetical protein
VRRAAQDRAKIAIRKIAWRLCVIKKQAKSPHQLSVIASAAL